MTQGATAFERSSESVVTSLVALAVSGDPRAFDALADRVGDGLYRRAFSILRDEPDARDAAQEALIRAWRELPRLQTSGELRCVAGPDPGERLPRSAATAADDDRCARSDPCLNQRPASGWDFPAWTTGRRTIEPR